MMCPLLRIMTIRIRALTPNKGDAVVSILTDEGWRKTTVQDDGHDGWDNAIAVDADGFWHMSAIDPAQFQSPDGVEYSTNKYDERYTVETIGSGPQPYEFATSIAVRDAGVVGVSFFQSTGSDMVYAERTAGADGEWTLETVDEGDVGRYSMLIYDADGNPHLTYFLRGDGDSGTVRYAWRDSDGEWHTEDVGTLEKAPEGHTDARKLTAIGLDSKGTPHIVYSDRLTLHYAQRTENGWTDSIIAESQTDDGNLGILVEFALDQEDNPHVRVLLCDAASIH